jgi:CRP/FNR family transcriptional regulator, anaerobic regulatory protein
MQSAKNYTEQDLQQLVKLLQPFITLDATTSQQLMQIVEWKSFQKNETILKRGAVDNQIYMLTKGIAFHQLPEGNKQNILWISSAGELLLDTESFLSRQPSHYNLIAASDVECFVISYDQLQSLYASSPAWDRCGRLIAEHYLLMIIRTVNGNRLKTVKERYQELVAQKPELLQQISLGQMASLLGVTQETLSRTRAKK